VLKVSVRETDKPPGESEDKPTEHKGKDEIEQIPAPLDVDKSCEDISHVALASFLDVRSRYVTFAVFKDKPLVRPPNSGRVVAATSLFQLPQPPQIARSVEHRVGDGCPALVARRQEVGRHGRDNGGRRGGLRRGEGRQDASRSADDHRRRRTVEKEVVGSAARHEVLQRRCVGPNCSALDDTQRAKSHRTMITLQDAGRHDLPPTLSLPRRRLTTSSTL